LNEKHHGSIFICRNLDSHDFWQLFRDFKKKGGDGICILWGFLSPFPMYRRNKKSGHGTGVCFLILPDSEQE